MNITDIPDCRHPDAIKNSINNCEGYSDEKFNEGWSSETEKHADIDDGK